MGKTMLQPAFEHLFKERGLPPAMHYDLGYINLEERILQPLDNPFDG